MVNILMSQVPKPKLFKSMLMLVLGARTTAIDRELPFAALLFTLLAASGVSIYESWKKLCSVSLLPTFQKEAREIVRQVEVLGHDPLTVMRRRAEKTRSKTYRDFLLGYISSVRSGGNLANYLRSKMRSIFDVQTDAAMQSVEKLGTLVEAYAVMLIVTLCSYILFIVFATTSLFEPMQTSGAPGVSTPLVILLVYVVTPLISVFFMVIAHRERKSNLMGLRKPYYVAALLAVTVSCFLAAINLTPMLEHLTGPEVFPLVVTACLLTISIPSGVVYAKISLLNSDAENSMPSFLRDITESRKIGLSPEKSVIHAAKRTGYGRFTDVLTLVRSQMEWGVSIQRIFANVRRRLQTWPVLVNFMILVETIKIGGGSASALEILTEYSEKQKDVETNKVSLLRPYVLLAFIWSVLIALTTTMVTMTVYALTQISLSGTTTMPFEVMQEQVSLFSNGILLQCWLSGFFVGKVKDGSFAAGFRYSAMLVLTAHISLMLSQVLLGGLYGLVS